MKVVQARVPTIVRAPPLQPLIRVGYGPIITKRKEVEVFV